MRSEEEQLQVQRKRNSEEIIATKMENCAKSTRNKQEP